MEEKNKTKTVKSKKSDNTVSKSMSVLVDSTIRGIVRSSNEIGIKKEDIVSLLKENGQFLLIYFK